ncbi:MAG: hypothetical protein IKV80_06970 [Bacteroidales bacterium]|nr:hypothetical protein [Bacteroidales bacterium]
MEQRNNQQDRIIFEIETLLNKMSNQVNFLIRKEMPMNQLDVDLLMENTRKLYDTICSIELGVRNEELGIEERRDVTPVASEELGVRNEVLGVEEFEDEDNDDNELIDFGNEEESDEEADMVWDFTKEELGIEERRDVTPVASEELGVRSEELGIEECRDVTPVASEELGVRSEELGVEDFEEDEVSDTEEEEEDPITDSLSDTAVDSKKEVSEKEEDSGIRAYRIIRENIPTLGDMLEQSEDKSLAARLQRKPVSDLITAIGINDKFLFLNELFGGSMEKYNKSIRSLNSFSTLLGAKTYMSELQIEFQWDCTSEAYKKLNDLVERRFI